MSELKTALMDRKQLQQQYNKHYRSAHPNGPTAEQATFLEEAQKNPNWKYIKTPKQRGVY